jgi:2-polyprenyl-3-methyl-5-hydroxy-6-metoxy-1,4-benzoquinol methylase
MAYNIDDLNREEAAFWNRRAQERTQAGHIPYEADIRRAVRVIPERAGGEVVDPRMTEILEGNYRDLLIEQVTHKPKGRVLEVCCGMGWLSLELGRHGQTVDAYDLSPEAISIGKRMLAENPYKDGFGTVRYHVQDVTQIDLGEEQFDAICGWSAFHHIPDLPKFMDRVRRALKPGGIVATIDDCPRGRLEGALDRAFRLLLPSYHRTYSQKFLASLKRLMRVSQAPPEVGSPMDLDEGKHETVHDMIDLWSKQFEIVENIQFNAFVSSPIMSLSGPDWFRYPMAHMLVRLDKILCQAGVCNGYLRLLIGRKDG